MITNKYMRDRVIVYMVCLMSVLSVDAQNCLVNNVTTTDVNVSVFIHEQASNSLHSLGVNYESDTIAVFYNDICVASKIVEDVFFAFSIWGDDVNTEIIDGLEDNEHPTSWLVKSSDNFLYHITPVYSLPIGQQSWISDAIVEIIDFTLDSITNYGCTNPEYMEYWQLNHISNCDDGSCTRPISSVLNTKLIDLNSEIFNLTNSLYESDSVIQDQAGTIDSLTTPVLNTLNNGWNIVGYNLLEEQDLEASFNDYKESIIIVKDNNGSVYMPEFDFNGIGLILPGYGYQVKTTETITDFYFYKVD